MKVEVFLHLMQLHFFEFAAEKDDCAILYCNELN